VRGGSGLGVSERQRAKATASRGENGVHAADDGSLALEAAHRKLAKTSGLARVL
jgi:hypothetical protein